MEKILVTGAAGQLGSDLIKELESRNIACRGVDIADFDLTNEAAVLKGVKEYMPTGIIHCAAYTAVDKAEDNYDAAYAVNAIGTKNIAAAAKAVDAKLLYISTDYVFGGEKDTPYDACDPKDPRCVYASTKYQGEVFARELVSKLFIVRLSWVFGKNGGNFVKTMLRLAETHDTLTVVNDQKGSPTYTPHVSRLLADMILTEKYGEYNASNEGYCTWYEFACEIFRQAGLTKVTVKPVTTAEYTAAKASRPKNSCFSKKELDENGFKRLPPWQQALSEFLAELK